MTDAIQTPREEQLVPPADEQIHMLVVLHTGEKFEVTKPVPGHDDSKIIRIVERRDGAAEVFALPTPGSVFDKMKQGFLFTFPAISVKYFMKLARFDVWQESLDIATAGQIDVWQDFLGPTEEDEEPNATNGAQVQPIANGVSP